MFFFKKNNEAEQVLVKVKARKETHPSPLIKQAYILLLDQKGAEIAKRAKTQIQKASRV